MHHFLDIYFPNKSNSKGVKMIEENYWDLMQQILTMISLALKNNAIHYFNIFQLFLLDAYILIIKSMTVQ